MPRNGREVSRLLNRLERVERAHDEREAKRIRRQLRTEGHRGGLRSAQRR